MSTLCPEKNATLALAVSALFHTSLACAPQTSVIEPEMGVEPLSPRKAATEAAFESTPFPRVVLDPPSLSFTLDRMPVLSAVVEIKNAGGTTGTYHVCKGSLPGWMRLENNEKGELLPGETIEIGITVDAVSAEAAAGKGPNGRPRKEGACAVLRVGIDAGGAGALLPVVCVLGDR